MGDKDSLKEELNYLTSDANDLLDLPMNPDLTKSALAKLTQMNSEVTIYATEYVWPTIKNVLERCLQPSVVGALWGIFCAITPLREIFIDIIDRSAHAPLQLLFGGLYSVRLDAVSINTMILGCNLSASQKSMAKIQDFNDPSTGLLLLTTMVGVIIGKMVGMPVIGIVTGWILKNNVWDIPDDIDGAFYLVLMIVFLTLTANNVMVRWLNCRARIPNRALPCALLSIRSDTYHSPYHHDGCNWSGQWLVVTIPASVTAMVNPSTYTGFHGEEEVCSVRMRPCIYLASSPLDQSLRSTMKQIIF